MADGDHHEHHVSSGAAGHDPHAGHDHAGHDRGNCDEALQELYSFLDGELTEAKRAKIAHHLDDCSPCLEVYDFEAELRIVIKHKCQEAVPDSLRSRVAERLAAIDAELAGRSPLGAATPEGSTGLAAGADAQG